MIQFKREPLTRALWDEAMPLIQKHWHEVAFYEDIPLNPDWNVYSAAASAGQVVVFTARKNQVELVGYALYFVKPGPHYLGSIQAAQDVIYLDPAVRGLTGTAFIQYIDAALAEDGVQVVFQHAKVAHPALGRVLERIGYQKQDIIYSRRLDRMGAEIVEKS